MGFLLRVLFILALIVLFEFYFFRKLIKSILDLFPGVTRKKLLRARNYSLLYFNLYPLVAIAVMVYIYANKIRGFSGPESFFFDWLVIYPFWVGLFIIVQSILWILPLDILKWISSFFVKDHKGLRTAFSRITLALILIFTVYVPARVIYDYNRVDLREVTHEKKNLDPALEGFRIALIADVQADRYTDEKRLERYVDRVNRSEPDLILIAGDIVTGSPKYIGVAAEKLSALRAKYGVYSCIGDHDNWAYRFDTARSVREITDALLQKNIQMIDDDTLALTVESKTIGLTFVTNTYVGRISPDKLAKLASRGQNSDFRIFLTHQPRNYLIEAAVKNRYDLYLAGHTHGGQVSFLFPFIRLTPTLMETPYVKGDFYFDDMLMVVNRGLGMSIAPLRYNSTPEVTLITLRNKSTNQ